MNCKIYADIKYKKYFNHAIKHQYKLNDSDINYDVVHNGIIVNEYDKGYGVFDEKYRFIKSSLQCHKGHKGQFIPDFDHNNIQYVDADAVYLCNMGRMQFGHFLLEHLNRAWFLLTKTYKTGMKVVLVNEKAAQNIPEYMFELLELIGVKHEDVLILDRTTKFRNVYIPDYCFDMDCCYSRKFRNIFKKMAESVACKKQTYEKIYVSRTRLPMNRRTYNEIVIENIFQKNGYKVIYPETLPLKQQIFLISNCKCLAGLGGTALHLALFMKPGGTVIQLKRNSINKDNADVQYVINRANELNSVFVWASIEKVKTEHYSNVPQIVGVTDYMKCFLDDNNFAFDTSDTRLDAVEYDEYLKCLQAQFGKNNIDVVNKLKKFIVHLIALVIPGRLNRGRIRSRLSKFLRVK